MFYLILAILSSVSVSIFLKLTRRYNIQTEQAIAVNYVTAGLLTWFLLKPDLTTIHTDGTSIAIFVALGILLPSVFIIMSQAVRYVGIIKTDVAQRLALFLPIIAAFTIFNEIFNPTKAIGVVFAFAALFCLMAKSKNISTPHTYISRAKTAGYLLGVWVGFGIIDILLKQIAKTGSATAANLFAAFVLSGVLIFSYLLIKRTKWSRHSLFSGVLLGGLNFANIWFYINAHKVFSANPTMVFAGMNVGVIALGTLVGALMFREKISRVNLLGILLSIASIMCLFYLDKLLPMFASH